MTSTLLWRGLALFLVIILGLTEAQLDSCDVIARDARQQKLQYKTELENLIEYFIEIFNIFYEDYTEPYFNLIKKYNNDFADVENKFKVKMRILNETKDIKNIITTEKSKLSKYHDSLLNVYHKYSDSTRQAKYILTNIYNNYFSHNETKVLSTYNCDPCVDKLKYSSCLKIEINLFKTPLDDLKVTVKTLSEEIETLSKVKRWDFLNNARRASKEAFDTLNRTLTVQQVKEYYITKLVTLYQEVTTVREKEHNYWRSENLLKSGKIIINILQYVLNKIKQPINIESNCDYVSVIKNILNVTSIIVSPYNRFPFWDLEDFASKYVRPVNNITDVDMLIKILEDVLRAGKKETQSSLPIVKVRNEINQYLTTIIRSFNNLYEMVINGYCPGISVIKEDAGQAAWDVFDCFVQLLKKSNQTLNHLYQYMNKLEFAAEYNNCYEKTLNI